LVRNCFPDTVRKQKSACVLCNQPDCGRKCTWDEYADEASWRECLRTSTTWLLSAGEVALLY